jgi:ureidoacrylate peracid hydrolase
VSIVIQAEPEPVEIDVPGTAVIVVDMQNAFVSPGGYFDLSGHDISATGRIIKPCVEIVNKARQKGIKIIYLQMAYSPALTDNEKKYSPAWRKSKGLAFISQHPELKDKFQVAGTWGSSIIKELEPQPADVVVSKQKYDGFIGTSLDTILRAGNTRYLIFIGTATNICVESTLRHAFSLEYFSILVSDATSQIGPVAMQDATIANVLSNFGWVTTTEKLLKALAVLDNL